MSSALTLTTTSPDLCPLKAMELFPTTHWAWVCHLLRHLPNSQPCTPLSLESRCNPITRLYVGNAAAWSNAQIHFQSHWRQALLKQAGPQHLGRASETAQPVVRKRLPRRTGQSYVSGLSCLCSLSFKCLSGLSVTGHYRYIYLL